MNKNTYIFILASIVIMVPVYFSYRELVNQNYPVIHTELRVPTIFAKSVINGTSETASASSSNVSSNIKTVIWHTNTYPTGVGVNINLIRQTSSSPRQFVLVRTLATNTPNDGQETFTLQPKEENLNNLYVEVTCSSSYQFKIGCNVANAGSLIKVN